MRPYLICLLVVLVGCVSYNRREPALDASYAAADHYDHGELVLAAGVYPEGHIIQGKEVTIWLAVENLTDEIIFVPPSNACNWGLRVYSAEGELVTRESKSDIPSAHGSSFPPRAVTFLEYRFTFKDLVAGEYELDVGLGCDDKQRITAPPFWVEIY